MIKNAKINLLQINLSKDRFFTFLLTPICFKVTNNLECSQNLIIIFQFKEHLTNELLGWHFLFVSELGCMFFLRVFIGIA